MRNLLSSPSAKPSQCVDYILSHAHGEYTSHDIKNVIVYSYFTYSSGVDPVMLISQMIHETGNLTSWWADRPRRNPAGIGVTGRTRDTRLATGKWVLKDGIWHEGNSYNDWMMGIWCHVGRVLCYRFTQSGGNAGQRHFMDMAHKDRPFPDKYRGKFNYWENLNGRWAVPGTSYAQSIIRIATEIKNG